MGCTSDTPEFYADKLPQTNPLGYVLAAIIAPPIIAFGAIYAMITAYIEKRHELKQGGHPLRASELENTILASQHLLPNY